ncbi:MAG: hypothetical protein ABSF67_15135 [Roseiarcus sp.]|jgi:hypothetical protein
MTESNEGDGARTPRRANITTISDHCHISRQRAGAILKAAGRRKGDDDKFVFATAVEVIMSSIDPARSAGHVAGGDSSALDDNTTNTIAALSSAKAAYEAARTRKMELSVAEIEKRLLPRDDVLAAAKDIAAHVRAGLAGVGAKTANDLAASTDASEAQRIVDEAINEALLKLCDLGAYLMGDSS